MDIQFWITIVIGVIWFLTRFVKAKTPDSPDDAGDSGSKPYMEPKRPQADAPRQLTFEELLKEITEGKAQKPIVARSEPVQQEVVDYDDNIGEEEQDLETIEPEFTPKKKSYEVYEEAKRQAFTRPSLEETMKVSDTDVKFGKFKEFERTEQRDLLAEYTKQFQDPEGLKKAVVMAEILNRKF